MNYHSTKLAFVLRIFASVFVATAVAAGRGGRGGGGLGQLIGTIPTETDAEKARVERIKQMTTAKIAPIVVYQASDAAKDVTGHIFGVRKNEIFLFSQPRVIRSVHSGDEGWTPQSVADVAIPAMQSLFYKLDRSGDIFTWDPI